jgi:competence protein ComEC
MHMLLFPLLFLLGDLGVQSLAHLPAVHWHHWALAGAALTLAWLWFPRSRGDGGCAIARGIVALLLGFVWTWFAAHRQLEQDLAPELEGQDVTVIGYIVELPEVESYGQRVVLVVQSASAVVPSRIELTWYATQPMLHAAQRWQLQVRLKRRHGFANPGGYDYEARLFRDGIGATGYVRNSSDNHLLGVMSGQWALKARAALVERLKQVLANDAMQGVVRGLAVGDQQAINTDAWQVFARTGVSHLMAISGFHIGMVAWLCAWLGRWLLWLPFAQRWRLTAPGLQALFGMIGAFGYSLLAGMSVPTQRTLIMLAVYFSARWLGRAVNVWHGFGVALLLVLLNEPFAPMTVGAWLSFGAVAVILLNQHGRVGHGPQWMEFIKLQVVVTLGLAPLLLAWFGNLSVVSPLVNLLAIPLFSAVLAPGVLLGCALLYVYAPLGAAWLHGMAWLIQYTYALLQWCAQLSFATWYWPALPMTCLALLIVGTVCVVLPWNWRLRVLGVALCLPAFIWRPTPIPAGAIRMTTLDVGQGLAVVIQTQTHVLLYDTGPVFQSGRDTGELVVLPYLRAQSLGRLDVLMASHGDADHVGGLHSVLRNVRVSTFMRGPSVEQELADDVLCQQGQSWIWNEVRFEVLWPDLSDLEKSDNNQSCVLRIDSANGSVLLMGDAEKPVEQRLLINNAIKPTTIVEAGHHGSRSSSSQAFVDAAQARYVVFSAGYHNRWGFPKADVTERWQHGGATQFSTIDSGAVTLTLRDGGKLNVELYRQQHRHYWQ